MHQDKSTADDKRTGRSAFEILLVSLTVLLLVALVTRLAPDAYHTLTTEPGILTE